MTVVRNVNRREELIQNIKDCGQSLIDNAEKMVDDYEFSFDLIITCYVDNRDEVPYISVDRHFYPENLIKKYME